MLLSLFNPIIEGILVNCDATNNTFEKVCSSKPIYLPPLPVIVDSEVFINRIQGVNEMERSISLFIELSTTWKDPGLSILVDSM